MKFESSVAYSLLQGGGMFASRWLLRKSRRIVCVCLLIGTVCASSGFVLTGPPQVSELNPTIGNAQYNNNLGPAGGGTFGFGGPKDIKRFFRWNIPYLVYSFDASFINYFGFEGMNAVHDAFRVLNDFFVPEDGSYEGVSDLDLARHGFSGNFNTTWINTTARNAQLIDIKSLVLGMFVNQIGLGNPHRHAFTVTGGTTNSWSAGQLNLNIRLRNYDPYTLKETDVINGVQYAYRLIHDGLPPAAGGLPAVTVLDVEEYTADTSGNAWTSVAAICDSFYGETMIYWTDQPTIFNFGVYYDAQNAMGGGNQPRHALTFDDAGGLKYLYSTNTYAWEHMDASVSLVYPAQFLPTTKEDMRVINPNWSGVPAGLNFQNATGKRLPVWPRQGAGLTPDFRYTTPILFQPVISSGPAPNNSGGVNNIGPDIDVLRGGIDKMQFYHQPMDSLLGINFIPTNFIWSFPFVAGNGYNIGGLANTTPGSSAWTGQRLFKFSTMTVGRTVSQPDFIFLVDDLGTSADGVPIAYSRPGNATWLDMGAVNWLTYYTDQGGVWNDADMPGVGPGTIEIQNTINAYFFTKLQQDFELIWSGETTVTGNQESYYSLWGHIKGPGPNDVIAFPRDATIWRVENEVIPDASPPIISFISDDGGVNPIEQNTYTRTEETLTIIGKEMASVTAIEIMNGDLVAHTVMPVDKYIQSNTRIDLPPGTFNESAEGAMLEIRVWNSVGVSQNGPQKFTIETGRPVITSTTADELVYDRAETLTIRGYGFKSRTDGKLGFLRVDDSQGSAVFDNGTLTSGTSDGVPAEVVGIEVRDDTTAVLPLNAVNAYADGSSRRLRVSRATAAAPHVSSVLSPSSNLLIAAITTKPVISSLSQMPVDSTTWEDVLATGMLKRDAVLEINGTALNTLDVIEVTGGDGSSFGNPVFIQLPNAAVSVEDNGTRVLVGAYAIPYPDADSNSSIRRTLTLYNAVAKSDLNASVLFAVNVQPQLTGISAFATSGFFNRDKTIGDDVTLFGSGLMAVGEIHIIEANGSDIDSSKIPKISLPNPGVTVTDTQIFIDTQNAQFSELLTADTDINSTSRLFKLVSARDNATSPLVDRFGIGAPPGMPVIAGFASANNYNRSTDIMTITGPNLGMITKVEIVDMFGTQIPGVPGLLATTGINVMNSMLLTIDANASGWTGATSGLDHVTALGRRIRVTTPFGQITSNNIAGGAFTVSGVPGLPVLANDQYVGPGYDGVLNIFTSGPGINFSVNGIDFRGVNRVTFNEGSPPVATGNFVDIDPNNLPAGISINSNGTIISISTTALNLHAPSWIGGGPNERSVTLRSAAGVSRTSQPLTVR